MIYKRLFTIHEIKDNFGYDLPKRAVVGDFVNGEASAEAWCDEAARDIHSLILKNRGFEFAKNIYFIDDDATLEALKMAQMYQMLFIIENGNYNAVADKHEDKKHYSEDALNILYASNILIYGF